jgi:hypothetical protein
MAVCVTVLLAGLQRVQSWVSCRLVHLRCPTFAALRICSPLDPSSKSFGALCVVGMPLQCQSAKHSALVGMQDFIPGFERVCMPLTLDGNTSP